MTNYMATGMGGQPQPQPRPSPQGQSSPSMNMNVSPEKRNALKNYLEGYKDAIQKKTMDQLLPNISAPQMPMQQPMQQPMMMNMGGVVDVFEPQYMSRGGVTVGSNFTNEDLKQAKEIVERVNKASSQGVKNKILDRSRPEVETIARGMIAGYDPDFGEEMGSENLAFAPMPNIDAGERAASYMLPSPSDDDLRMDEDKVESINPMYEDFKKSQESMFAPLVNKIGMGIMGYKDPFELYKATQATLDPDSMQSRIARDRQLDRERAERKLAEEQRMRAMIQSMLPAPAETVEPPEEFFPLPDPGPIIPEAPTSPVVESTRVPDFTIPALPTLPATSPLLPPGISPELLRNLFKLQGVPATAMQEGGSVNKLDTAVDNFLSAVRQ